ncbi:MAG: hypothetical protein JWQ75_147 [Pseudarthrobacter sp.]|nr:hypothetical protein [Pseudarthrobacter sp.]
MKHFGLNAAAVVLLAMMAGAWSSALGRPVRRAHAPGRPGTGPADHPERGDVPGWVMITLMSAVLVAGLLALAGPALEAMFTQAMDKVGS